MSQIMSHLVGNFPNPMKFQQTLETILKRNITYLEIQFPFTHPVGDGPVIYEANQTALNFPIGLKELIEEVGKTKLKIKSRTKLILMGYLTPFLDFGLENLTKLLYSSGFEAMIIPDISFGSSEQKKLSNLIIGKLSLIPVISPLTNTIRLNKIKSALEKGQLVYATARSGQTGPESNLESEQIKSYFEFLKSELKDYMIAVGFGIKNKQQVGILNQQDFIAVIGSEIVRQINSATESNLDLEIQINNFFNELE